MKERWFVRWRPYRGNLEKTPVAMNEYLPVGQSMVLGAQHAFAMFGATILAPLLMGFDPSLTMLITGIGTILFFLITGGHVPSYLGSSFAFIGAVAAATGYAGAGSNPNIALALGGTIVCGVLYAIVGLMVMRTGTQWIEKLMPPVVTGTIVMIIGLNLAPVTIKSVSANNFDAWMALVTILCIGTIAVFTRGMIRRLLLLIGLVMSYAIYFVCANVMGLGKPIDFNAISNAAWFGLPAFHQPVFQLNAILLIAPVFIILIAENLGHFKAVSAMTGQNISPYMGRAFFADGLCTTLSASVGGTGMTTYAENIGVMAATKIYSTVVFVIAGVFAILLGLSPKFGSLISTIPVAILGGASIVVFGLITIAGARIWISNQVDFSKNGNMIVAAIALIMGAGNYSLHIGNFDLGGIGTATFAAILMNLVFNRETRTLKTGSGTTPLTSPAMPVKE
ncbi:NCS2 family nucleobase:cation symporter [Acinetobacter radioresistens]|jgi:putative pyrimidine permease RutG|uniref:Pyrimidine utilization transport protein G n=1 Tax=Acinetobacter radioresistens SK82 TaxID=596318 RepID=A0ABP2GMG3_ACIRA|nr:MULTISPECIES: solute carrier family 23 protein [Acinetobacter]EET82944.1 putative pyrimidine utilization transport protein G [Acinetobacter radioresistens SK82]EJO35386.1 putative pyrimidine utilization transport protein G [Acinetobacter radioresistens WC-A-157]ENV84895.1 pyrimidine utilization transporter G [Acinetobacter radioresistens NIPH 2130]EXB86446.1 putative pyrimidine permease RutG [Acinetobacter sp. 272263]EXE57456.1 putative pyrimidine permease RutG [Acinetobacter sp. 1239920]